MVRRKSNVGFLVTSWGNEGVNFLNLDVVQLLARLLNHSFICSLVNDEYECIVVFNGLDGRLTAQWVLDDSILVEGVIFIHSSQDILWGSLLHHSLWSSEGCLSPDLRFFHSV